MSPVVIPAGMPGPDGVIRAYPIHLDAYDLLYGPDEVLVNGVRKAAPPIATMAEVAEHYNRAATENGNPLRVRVDGAGLVWLNRQPAGSTT